MAEELFILSDAAAREFEQQDVFTTVSEFIDAMPPATRMVHLYPVSVEMLQEMEQGGVELTNRSELEDAGVLAGDENLFSWLTWTHTTPDREDPPMEDESIFRVDDANDLLKDQQGEFMDSGTVHDMHDKIGPPMEGDGVNYMRDEGQQDFHMIDMPYDYRDMEDHEWESKPGDFDDYARNNFYRDFEHESGVGDHMSFLAAVHMADFQPVSLPLAAEVVDEREVTAEYFLDGRVARLVPGPVRTRVAAKWGEIIKGLNPDVVANAEGCQTKLTRSDPKNRRWTFTVRDPKQGSGKNHTVHLKVVPRGNTSDLNKLDLKVGCSCEFWKWHGPDYHAASNGYLDRLKRSDGSTPDVRDPSGKNRVCKHVYAASQLFMNYRLQKRKKSARSRTASMKNEVGTQVRVAAIAPSEALNLRKLAILADETYTSQRDLASKIEATAGAIHTDKDS